MREIWKDVIGFEGFYQVSNLGRVKSLSRKVLTNRPDNNHKYNNLPEKILKNNICTKYPQVILSRYGKTKAYSVHRLVAQAFIPNPNNYPCVNHKDENPKNNNVDNLEWCTYKYNNEYNGRVEKCKHKISQTLMGRTHNNVLTETQREHISEGAKRGWETRKRNTECKKGEIPVVIS